jgi:arylsulfatase A-like enzyme
MATLMAVNGFNYYPGHQAMALAASRAHRSSRPSIVLILTDDQRFDELRGMPLVRQRLIERGRRLTQAFVVNPLCCPSRIATLTGTYSHTNGVYLNGDGGRAGGFRDFDDDDTLPIWLREKGYRTALIGKYLNHYRTAPYVPPGWTRWRALLGNSTYYDYDVSMDGRQQHFGRKATDYATDVFARMAARFIRSVSPRHPLFLYFAPPAPHGPHTPAPRHADSITRKQPRHPSFNESDVSDKPSWVEGRPRLSSRDIKKVKSRWQARARTLMAVDDAVGRIVAALKRTHRLRNTLIVFTSDNGNSLGEHRLGYKMNAYEESIRVPLIVRWDGRVPGGTRSRRLVTNIDMAPTFAAVAGAPIPSWVNGVSMLPLLRHGRSIRGSFLIEHVFSERPEDPPTYCAIRTGRWKLVHYSNSDLEFYDLRRDPWELHNLATKRALADERRALLERLRRICRPPPPGMAAF